MLRKLIKSMLNKCTHTDHAIIHDADKMGLCEGPVIICSQCGRQLSKKE